MKTTQELIGRPVQYLGLRICLLFTLWNVSIAPVHAQDPVSYEQAFPNLTFEFPLEIQHAGDGTNRLFVVEQPGRIRVFNNDSGTSELRTFLDIRNLVTFSTGQEIGLLGLAFHPNFKQNGYFYVYHTRYANTVNYTQGVVLARYRVNSSDPNRADPSSRVEIFSVGKNYNSNNHNGGKIAFGPDGYLYMSLGDGGGFSDPYGNAQNLNVPFGSMLRIDVDMDGSNPVENNPLAPNGRYEIPRDNPRVGKSGLDELYAWGLRNTWKFSFDIPTGRLWGGDVGQDRSEEINLIQKGGNYGWDRYEGTSTESGSTNLATSPDIKPVHSYNHDNGDVSITGGYVYRGSSPNTAIQGKYIYADYVSGRVWSLNYNAGSNTASPQQLFRTNGEYISSFGLDEAGELYFCSYGNSAKLYKVVGGNPSPGPETVTVDGVGLWKSLEDGVGGTTEAIAVDGDDIYIGGSFSVAGSIPATNIVRYNKKTGWTSLSNGINGRVYALAVASDGKVYAGGDFSAAGGVSARNIAVWNGSAWSALGSGTNGPVAKVAIDGQGRVYVGGGFETAGGLSVGNIARWNGSSWSALADSDSGTSGTNNEIRALAFDENDVLYVGGNFDRAGGKTAQRIATWDGNRWGTLGEGTSGFVQAIVITPSTIYAGGNFSIAGNKTVNRVARWSRSSSNWQALGSGLSGNVNAMVHDGNHLYVAGSFNTAANTTSTNYVVNNMARWSSSKGWEALGPGKNTGVDNIVRSLSYTSDGDHILVGGNFAKAGNTSVSNLAQWGLSFDCSDERLTVEYAMNGSWSSGESTITADAGTTIKLRLSDNGQGYTVTSPNGVTVSGELDLGQVSSSDNGTYTFRTDSGCSTTLGLTVTTTGDPCADGAVIPEYRIDGLWQSGDSDVRVEPGTEVMLSMLPNGVDLTITLPDGREVGDNHNLGAVAPGDSGSYVLTTGDGCVAVLNLTVGDPCTGELIPEYRINGLWQSGSNIIRVQQGDDLVLSMLPNGIDLDITLPSGQVVGDNYSLGNVSDADAGTYLLKSEEGCSEVVQLVVDSGTTCPPGELIPEYRVDGVWYSGSKNLSVTEGTHLVLSMLPNGVDLDITLPNGSQVGDNYNLGRVDASHGGTYLLRREDGCTETFNLTVTSEEPCSGIPAIPEYNLNGTWYSGSDYLQVDAGTYVVLSMLPNDIGLTITLPDGTRVSDNYSLGRVNASHSGTYILEPAVGCKTVFQLFVNSPGLTSLTARSDSYGPTGASDLPYVYPNPTTDYVTVDVSQAMDVPVTVYITDMKEQRLWRRELGADHGQEIEVDFSEYSSGLYFLVIEKNGGASSITHKIIKQ